MERRNNFPKRGNNNRGSFRGRGRGRGRGMRERPTRGNRGMWRGPIRGNRGRKGPPIRDSSFISSNREEINTKNGINFSYEKIKDIINKDDNEIIQYLMNFKDLSEVFENTKFSIKKLDLFTELLMKISKINSAPASNSLYQILKNTNFNNMAKKRLAKEEYKDENYLYFINNLILLNDKLIDKYTDDTIRIKYGDLSEYVDIIKIMIDKGEYINNLQLVKDIVINLDKLTDKEMHKKVAEFEQKQKEREENIINDDNNNIDKISIDYKNRNIYLSSNDILENEKLKIAPHLKYGSYKSYDRYINTMFYLEYQDCYKDLKETIKQLNKSINKLSIKELYQLSKDFSNIYFYLEGEIKCLELDREGAIITIEFKTHYKKNIKFTKE